MAVTSQIGKVIVNPPQLVVFINEIEIEMIDYEKVDK